MTKPRLFLYGAFQDGTLKSRICTERNFGDLMIYETLRRELSPQFDVYPVLPDHVQTLLSLAPEDFLVIGGGGLIHPMLTNAQAIRSCKAKKAVFGVGINWRFGEVGYGTIQELIEIASYAFEGIPFVSFRDCATRDMLGFGPATVRPDATLLAAGNPVTFCGDHSAVVLSGVLPGPEGNETIILLNSGLIGKYGTTEKDFVTDPMRFRYFPKIRTSNYHGMIFGLMAGAQVKFLVSNSKHVAFLESYYEHLRIEERWPYLLLSDLDGAWFAEHVKKGIDELKDHLLT